MKLRIILLYGVFLMVSFLFLATLWHWQMAGRYFVSQEHGFILDFVPPFISPGVSGDFFIKPAYVVYTVWGVYAGLVLVVPAIGAWLLTRLYERDLKQAWC